jgi:hypothetical protein
VKLSDLSPLPSCSPLPFCASSVAFLHSPLECLILRLVNGSGSKGATARFKGATIVSRFRSSPEFAARSEANFGIEGHQRRYDSSAALNPKFAIGLAAIAVRTSGSRH